MKQNLQIRKKILSMTPFLKNLLDIKNARVMGCIIRAPPLTPPRKGSAAECAMEKVLKGNLCLTWPRRKAACAWRGPLPEAVALDIKSF